MVSDINNGLAVATVAYEGQDTANVMRVAFIIQLRLTRYVIYSFRY